MQDPRRQELELELRKFTDEKSPNFRESKRRLASYVKSLKGGALRRHQETWIQRRRDWKIVTRGKEQAHNPNRTDVVERLYLLFPKRARLAQRLVSEELLTAETKWLAMTDLYTFCTRDSSVLYLPGCQPVEGRCPIECCQLELER